MKPCLPRWPTHFLIAVAIGYRAGAVLVVSGLGAKGPDHLVDATLQQRASALEPQFTPATLVAGAAPIRIAWDETAT